MKKFFVFLGFVMFLGSCGQVDRHSMDSVPTPSNGNAKSVVQQTEQVATHSVTASTPDLEDNAALFGRKIVKQADCKMKVENVEASTNRIRHAVAIHGGFVASMNLSGDVRRYQNHLVLRVPDENFEALFNDIGKEALIVDHKRITSDDVTEQFIDNESRLKTKKEVQQRYTDILRKKATTIEEVLETEEKIRKIQEEIDAHEGRLQYLSHKVDLSSIALNIYELKPAVVAAVTVVEVPSVGEQFREAFVWGWQGVLGILLFFTRVWPLLFVGVILGLTTLILKPYK